MATFRRREPELAEQFGHEVTEHVRANLRWEAYQFLGKLQRSVRAQEAVNAVPGSAPSFISATCYERQMTLRGGPVAMTNEPACRPGDAFWYEPSGASVASTDGGDGGGHARARARAGDRSASVEAHTQRCRGYAGARYGPVPFADSTLIVAGMVRELRAAVAEFPPFRFTINRLDRFGGPPAVLYGVPEPPAPFVRLTERLRDRFGFLPYGGEHTTVIPHLTIATRLPGAELDQIEADVVRWLPIESSADACELWKRTDDGWRLMHSIPFAAGSSSPR